MVSHWHVLCQEQCQCGNTAVSWIQNPATNLWKTYLLWLTSAAKHIQLQYYWNYSLPFAISEDLMEYCLLNQGYRPLNMKGVYELGCKRNVLPEGTVPEFNWRVVLTIKPSIQPSQWNTVYIPLLATSYIKFRKTSQVHLVTG